MADREKVIKAIEICYTLGHNCTECVFFSEDDCNDKLMCDVLTLLKEQDERYVSMVISWLSEIAINNVDSNMEMTFLDAVEDIRDRASYGLKQYFVDKQKGR